MVFGPPSSAGLCVEEIEDPARVGVSDTPRDPHFGLEAFDDPRAKRQIRPNQLQRHQLVEIRVQRLVDLAHAALAETAYDLKPAANPLAGQQCGRGPWLVGALVAPMYLRIQGFGCRSCRTDTGRKLPIGHLFRFRRRLRRPLRRRSDCVVRGTS